MKEDRKDLKIQRFFEMPRKFTFEQPKLREWVLSWCHGRCLNVFAGPTILMKDGCTFVSNDKNAEIRSDYHVDAAELDTVPDIGMFDTVLLDPPYTMYQAVHSYRGVKCQDITAVRTCCDKLLKRGGTAISLGYNSTGFGEKRGYDKQAILLCNNGGSHNDIIVTVERKLP